MVIMRDAMDRLIENSFALPRNGDGYPSTPNLDMIEKDDQFIVKAELPGFNPENVDIRVEGNTLTLKGEYKEEKDKQEGAYHVHERHQGNFVRTIALPAPVKVNAANAEFESGVLTLTLPKDKAALPKKIDIKTIATPKK